MLKMRLISATIEECRGGGMADTEALRAFACIRRESSTLSRGTKGRKYNGE